MFQTNKTDDEEVIDKFEDDCDNAFFKKIKYTSQKSTEKYFSNFYDIAFVEKFDMILLEIDIKQDSSKTISERSST